MVLREIQGILEAWAPKELAWERDNVGLQIGSSGKDIRKILVALDVTDEIIAEARRKRIDLIITHHPLLFHPLRSVNFERRAGRLTAALVKNNIALYAVHTNLDFAPGGVSEKLAEKLGLRAITVLEESVGLFKKIAVFIPEANVDEVTAAMAGAGAGALGNYESCSFRTAGTGTFKANENARPFLGRRGITEHVAEVRVEMLAPVWKLEGILAAMIRAHPYEEVAHDIFDLANTTRHYGAGAVGTLPRPTSLRNFLMFIRGRLKAPVVRYSGNPARGIHRVAVCGGSGSDHLAAAIKEEADAYVTSDIRFHTFQDADGKIALIDAGHYETEQPVIPAIAGYLKAEFSKRKLNITVDAAATSRNVVQYSYS